MPYRTPLPIRSGSATVLVGPELSQFLDKIEDATLQGVRTRLKHDLEQLKNQAEADWYQQVKKRTGKTGTLKVVEIIRNNELVYQIQPVDMNDKVSGKWRGFFVHRPSALSLVGEPLDDSEYANVMSTYRATGSLPKGFAAKETDSNGRPTGIYRTEPNPLASDGKFLVPELLTRPANKLKDNLVKTLGQQISALAGR